VLQRVLPFLDFAAADYEDGATEHSAKALASEVRSALAAPSQETETRGEFDGYLARVRRTGDAKLIAAAEKAAASMAAPSAAPDTGKPECWSCVHFARFPPPPGNPLACYGCNEPNWSGSVRLPERPPCGGVAFTPKCASPGAGGADAKEERDA
jgi:hypothetical protein